MLADSTRIPPEAGGGRWRHDYGADARAAVINRCGSGDASQRPAIAVLEAMKMQHELIAPGDGAVVDVMAMAGKQIGAGDLIMMLELEE